MKAVLVPSASLPSPTVLSSATFMLTLHKGSEERYSELGEGGIGEEMGAKRLLSPSLPSYLPGCPTATDGLDFRTLL